MQKIFVAKWKSPIGELALGEIEGEICLCDWSTEHRHAMWKRLGQRAKAEFEELPCPTSKKSLAALVRELEEYFCGERKAIDMPLRMFGTEFQLKVWAALREIPYGDAISYAELARRIGKPTAVRAVAVANSQNPISILVPCHRVLGADGRLTGYAGGLAAKRALLVLEGALPVMPLV